MGEYVSEGKPFKAASRTHSWRTCARCTRARHQLHWCMNTGSLGFGALPKADARDRAGNEVKVCAYCKVKPREGGDE